MAHPFVSRGAVTCGGDGENASSLASSAKAGPASRATRRGMGESATVQ